MTLTLDFQGQILKKSYRRNGMAHWNGTKGMWVDRMLDSHCDFKLWPHPWPWPWIFKVKYGNCCKLNNGRFDSLGMKGMWVGYDVGCTMGLTCGHGAWQIDRQSSGSMWNSYSFQPVGQWMSYSFTDLGAEGCCRSLNALLFSLSMLLLLSLLSSLSFIIIIIFLHTKPWILGVRNSYSQLLFTSEDRLCANLLMQEQSRNMTSQCQYLGFAWRHRSTVVMSQC